MNIHDLKSTVLGRNDGMPAQRISSFHFSYDSSDGSNWFACKNILCQIPANIRTNEVPPHLKIAELAVLNDTILDYPPRFVALKHFQNDLKISLSTINFTDPSDMRFAYRLKDENDTNWIEAGTQPTILLTNIPPGNYALEMKVYSHDNKWPDQATAIEIVIKPPFWRTWWFLSFVSILVAASVYSIYRRRIRQVKEKANIDRQLTEYEMKALHAQMNPHFIFNCLNSIREMILNNENTEASHYLSKFAHLIRITLNNSTKPFISLENNIDYLRRYLEMEQIRNHNFNYSIEVDDQLESKEIMIPPMVIQPFLENAIWHGASPGNKLQLTITFLRQGRDVVCIVDDNGIGIDASIQNKTEVQVNHNSIGIANVKERIQVLNEKYNLQSSVTIEDKSNRGVKNARLLDGQGTGTTVKLYFPVKNSAL